MLLQSLGEERAVVQGESFVVDVFDAVVHVRCFFEDDFGQAELRFTRRQPCQRDFRTDVQLRRVLVPGEVGGDVDGVVVLLVDPRCVLELP